MRQGAIMWIICGVACGLGAWVAAERGLHPATAANAVWDGRAPDWAPPAMPGPVRIEAPQAPPPPVSPEPSTLAFLLGPESAGSPYAFGYGARAAEVEETPRPVAPMALFAAGMTAGITGGGAPGDDLCGAASACVLPLALVASDETSGRRGATDRRPRAALSTGATGLVTFGGGGGPMGFGGLSALADVGPDAAPFGEPRRTADAAGGGGVSYGEEVAISAVPSPMPGVLLGGALALSALLFARPRARLARLAAAA